MRTISFLIASVALAASQSVPLLSASNDEILKVADEMRNGDENKASKGQIIVDFGGHVNFNGKADASPNKLFTAVDSSLLSKPTFAAFIKLFNNYNSEAGIKEPKVSSTEDNAETKVFLDAIETTKPYQILLKFLQARNHPYGKSSATLKEAISRLWFDRYSRARGVLDTSGFEHVFIGELKNGEVSGLHNWVRINDIETDPKQNFDYKGFIVKRGTNLATIQFSWGKEWKKGGSTLIGTSPEYDLSVLTLCFLARRDNEICRIKVDGCPVEVQSYELKQNGKSFIGTAFPKIAGQCW
ncbi:hypothetical protein PFISCL1PPCAC_23829 [Pristionchus fissidentatus]|uniref:EndoU domain-containing protein n=1 Tax=Pristionchus fissidentatus TaxID=1538716 RepID=A0AAV5WRY9_9BILA|nr:hypothetical protein PFISCL1PPCAC_23829 [Pristionchus fissidentatus]